MKERGRYQIQFMKTRSSSGVGQKVDLEFNVDTLRINDLGEDEDQASFSQGGGKSSNSSNSVYAGLKRTSTVSTTTDPETGEIRDVDPTHGANIKQFKPKSSGPAIRTMLNNLHPEKD
jgi:hypothetical protein